MRMDVEMQKQKNHALYKSKRREIARMKTALTTMESGKKSQSKEILSGVVTKISSNSSEKPSQAKKKSVKGVRSKSTKS